MCGYQWGEHNDYVVLFFFFYILMNVETLHSKLKSDPLLDISLNGAIVLAAGHHPLVKHPDISHLNFRTFCDGRSTAGLSPFLPLQPVPKLLPFPELSYSSVANPEAPLFWLLTKTSSLGLRCQEMPGTAELIMQCCRLCLLSKAASIFSSHGTCQLIQDDCPSRGAQEHSVWAKGGTWLPAREGVL